MANNIIQTFKQALMFIIFFTLLTGVVYPLLVNISAQLLFKNSANGSLVERDGVIVGSKLIGQQFTSRKYFWSRPSATKNFPYNPIGSSGSNLGPSNPALLQLVQERIALLKAENPLNKNNVPIDLVTTSASGLDPHISLIAAYYQVERIANERKIKPQEIMDLLDKRAVDKNSIFSVPCVNVLDLNLALDQLHNDRKL